MNEARLRKALVAASHALREVRPALLSLATDDAFSAWSRGIYSSIADQVCSSLRLVDEVLEREGNGLFESGGPKLDPTACVNAALKTSEPQLATGSERDAPC